MEGRYSRKNIRTERKKANRQIWLLHVKMKAIVDFHTIQIENHQFYFIAATEANLRKDKKLEEVFRNFDAAKRGRREESNLFPPV